MCQRGQHHQIVPPPPPCISLTLLICEGAIVLPTPIVGFPSWNLESQKEKKNKGLPPPRVRYILRVPKPAPTVLHFQSLCSFSSACTLPRVSPRLQNFPPFIPLSLLRLFPLSSSVELPSNFFEYIYRCQETVLTTEA